MRPMTWFVSGVAVVGLLVLAGILIKFGWRSGPTEAAAEEEVRPAVEPARSVDAAAPRQVARPAWAGMNRRRPLPKFEPTVLAPASAVRATAQDLERVREQGKEDGTLFREAGSDKIYVVQKGAKFLVPDQEEFGALGYSAEKVNEVPPGALAALQDRPPDGTLIKERGHDHVWLYEGGKKRHIVSAWILGQRGYKWGDVKTIPTGSLADYNDGPPVQ